MGLPARNVEEPITYYRVVAERAPVPKSGHGPLVGRDRELAQLEESWARAQAGTSQFRARPERRISPGRLGAANKSSASAFEGHIGSTVLSTRVEPETYRLLVGRYREQVLRAVNHSGQGVNGYDGGFRLAGHRRTIWPALTVGLTGFEPATRGL